MKRRLFYLLLICCSLSIFSSAKQNGKDCGKETLCSVKKQDNNSVNEMNVHGGKGFDLSPVQLFVFGI